MSRLAPARDVHLSLQWQMRAATSDSSLSSQLSSDSSMSSDSSTSSTDSSASFGVSSDFYNDILPPVLIDDTKVPDELVCSICYSAPTDAHIVTKCHQAGHVAKHALTHNAISTAGNTIVGRMWSSIQVKFSNHTAGCNWKGGIADYRKHIESCDCLLIEDFVAMNASLETELRQLKLHKDKEICRLEEKLARSSRRRKRCQRKTRCLRSK